MPADGEWFITPHAVCQYMELRASPSRFADAQRDLVAFSRVAHYVKEAPGGCMLYRGPRPKRLRFIVEPPRGPADLPVLVTVLRDPIFRARQQGRRDERRTT